MRRYTAALLAAWFPITSFLMASSLMAGASSYAQPPAAAEKDGDALVARYFREQTDTLTDRCLAEIDSLKDWEDSRETYRQQLLEMLGLSPYPDRTDLEPVVTGTIEREGIIAERVHFQSLPGLYVTGNFYRPAGQTEPLPAILYVCGHGGVKKDGVSLGNKTHYQHHGAWFARNGYVCLTIDTIQLGEIEGIHHGTYREKMWWWNNRGYTPAGVEAWNCVRALDYLESRDEVDPTRFGVTGRSGGGAYSWWSAAIDDRIKVAVPVAGITSLKNHVVDGCVEGHCDCMFMVNTYRWDYPMVAALIAPRPLLISNTDKDRIFPLDGVIDVHAKLRRIYDLYGASDKLGLHITEGPHKDTQELRVHAFRWFNRFLKNDESLLQSPATAVFEQEDLRVFRKLPADERVTSIHETFVPTAQVKDLPTSAKQLERAAQAWRVQLAEKTFRGWPERISKPTLRKVAERKSEDAVLTEYEFESESPFDLPLIVLDARGYDARGHAISSAESPGSVVIEVLDEERWTQVKAGLASIFRAPWLDQTADQRIGEELLQSASQQRIAFFAPRGIGPTAWSDDERTHTHIRRRFMQLGQTLAGMQTFDLVRAIEAVSDSEELSAESIALSASGDPATWALFAALMTDAVASLQLGELPIRNRSAPDLLNVSRVIDVPQALLAAAQRVGNIDLFESDPEGRNAWRNQLAGNPLAENLIQIHDEADF